MEGRRQTAVDFGAPLSWTSLRNTHNSLCSITLSEEEAYTISDAAHGFNTHPNYFKTAADRIAESQRAKMSDRHRKSLKDELLRANTPEEVAALNKAKAEFDAVVGKPKYLKKKPKHMTLGPLNFEFNRSLSGYPIIACSKGALGVPDGDQSSVDKPKQGVEKFSAELSIDKPKKGARKTTKRRTTDYKILRGPKDLASLNVVDSKLEVVAARKEKEADLLATIANCAKNETALRAKIAEHEKMEAKLVAEIEKLEKEVANPFDDSYAIEGEEDYFMVEVEEGKSA